MENLSKVVMMLFLDAGLDAVHVVSWGPLILMLVIVLVLAVAFSSGLSSADMAQAP